MLLPPGEAYSLWYLRDDTGALRALYVNLEEPAQRWDDGHIAGVDIVDQDLDILVRPDGRWEWKDEEEFVERLTLPAHYWVPDEAAVRAEGERVIKKIEAGEFPFDGSYLDFRPDPAWTLPEAVPAGWERPRAHPTAGPV
jgi:predicted RNA-binding protein associated with RNAse of E/G family